MTSAPTRLFWALIIHAAIAVPALALLFFLGSGDDALNEATRLAYGSRPDGLEDVRSAAVWGLALWTFIALAADWVLAGIWIVLAERQRPATPAQGAGMRGSWAIFLIISMLATSSIGWRVVWNRSLQLDLATSLLTMSVGIVFLTTLIAYWTSTAVCVKRVMRRSVPLENVFPSIGSRA